MFYERLVETELKPPPFDEKLDLSLPPDFRWTVRHAIGLYLM